MAWVLAQGFGCTRSIPLNTRLWLARFFEANASINYDNKTYIKHIASIIKLYIVFLIVQTL